MHIVFTHAESEELFHTALCNAVGTSYMDGYGIELTFDKDQYAFAKTALTLSDNKSICYEDVLLKILQDGGTLTFTDVEGEGENDSTITIHDVHEKVAKTPFSSLCDMLTQQDDASTASVLLQTVFYDNVIFG